MADRETWAKRVEQWKESGLSAKEFAAQLGVAHRSLVWWKWYLGKSHEPSKEAAKKPRARTGELSPMTFVEVAPQPSLETLEIVWPSGVRVRVPSNVERAVLDRVIDAIEKRR